jgi:hypothetical protein
MDNAYAISDLDGHIIAGISGKRKCYGRSVGHLVVRIIRGYNAVTLGFTDKLARAAKTALIGAIRTWSKF